MNSEVSGEKLLEEVLPPKELIPVLKSQFPSRFRVFPDDLPDRQADPVVGVPFETNANRFFWLDQTKEILMEGGHMVIVIVDLDQLKHYNEAYGRQVGDVGILYAANSGANLVDEFFPSSEARLVIVSRESHAADETIFVLRIDEDFPIEDRLYGIREKARTIPPVATRGVRRNNDEEIAEEIAMTFSLGVVSSRDPKQKKFLKETIEALKTGRLERPYDLFVRLKQVALDDADENKNEKIETAARGIIEKETLTPYGLAKKLAERFSGYRLKEKVHLFIIEQTIALTVKVAAQIAAEFGLNRDEFEKALKERTGYR